MKIPFNKETATFFKYINKPFDIYWMRSVHGESNFSIYSLIDEEGIIGETSYGNKIRLVYDGALTWIESDLFNNKSLFELVLK